VQHLTSLNTNPQRWTRVRDNGTWGSWHEDADKAYVDTAIAGTVQIAGDLGGTTASPTVDKIKGIDLPASAPATGEVLTATSTTATAWQAPSAHTHTASQISDSTATGRSVLTAADATAARSAIGAGTSDLVIGTTASTAKAGNYQPTAADISDSGAAGRALLTSVSTGSARTAIGAVGSTTVTTIQILTQAAYDAIGTKDSNTIYIVEG
jgi:hypothetical protein